MGQIQSVVNGSLKQKDCKGTVDWLSLGHEHEVEIIALEKEFCL